MDQKVRCKRDQNSYAGYVPNKTEKINLNKKIFSTAFETIVANADHNYVLDPINKVYLGQKHFLAHQFSYSILKSINAEKFTGFN